MNYLRALHCSWGEFKERNTKTNIEPIIVLLGFTMEWKGVECVHEARLTVFDSVPELSLGNLVLPVASCFSQNTTKWINAQLLFYSDQSKTRKKHTEMQEDTQEGNKWIMTKPRLFTSKRGQQLWCHQNLTFHSLPYFLICTNSSAAQIDPASQERVCIMPRPVGQQANICSEIDKGPSTSCSEKGEIQSKNNCCTGAEQEESGLLYRYTVCAQTRKPADIPWAGGCPEPTGSTIPIVNPEGNYCTCQEEKTSSNHQDAKSLVRRVPSRVTHESLHSLGMFWKKDVGEHPLTTHLAEKFKLLLQLAEMAFTAQEPRIPHSPWLSWVTRSVVSVKVTAIQTLWFLLVSKRDEVYAITLCMFCPSVKTLQTF